MAAIKKPLPPGPGQRPYENHQYENHTNFITTGQENNIVLAAAIDLLSWGFSVIPANEEKRATLSWKPYQSQAMSVEAAKHVFQNGCRLAIVCGAVSGNLECLDFDRPDLFNPFIASLENSDEALANSLVQCQTPSGGYHLIYRCSEPIQGNQKLATSADGIETWIETRGEGGYFLTAPSLGYKIISNSLNCIPVISPEQLSVLHTIAFSFNDRRPKKVDYEKRGLKECQRPGDDFNNQADEFVWRGLLEPEGWKFLDWVTSGGRQLRRPGKTWGNSASLKKGCLYVFSTNAGFPTGPHDAFGVFAHLKHGGDFKKAAKDLAQQGYGSQIKASGGGKEWRDPEPIISKLQQEAYPIDALPYQMEQAVKEVQDFTKAPLPLVASSAIGALSLAVQGHIDVRRDNKLIGPVSLFLLTIADSGERKSTCDQFFAHAIQQYQHEQSELAKPELKNYIASMEAWKAKRNGLIEKIKNNTKNKKSTKENEDSLNELEFDKPIRPRIPRFILGDETPENLAWVLSHDWPSGSVISSEAGIVFGSHGMNKDSIMRNLSLLNILWDGGELSIGRRTSESFIVRGARLTMALQVQEATLRSFFERSGDLARGTGFLARFLIAWPESTQGLRQYSEPPSNWPALEAFNKVLAGILEHPVVIDENGSLSTVPIHLTPHAKTAWISFHDEVESQLITSGAYHDIRDVASKAADNSARLAGLFHVLKYGAEGKIEKDTFISASRIAKWHLNEARRFFGELSLPDKLKNAQLLDGWLMERFKNFRISSIPRREIQQYGPSCLRKGNVIVQALDELEQLGRFRVEKTGNRKIVSINPALIDWGF